MRTLAILALIAAAAALPATAQEKGRVLAAIGICTDSVGDMPVIKLRRVDKSAHHNIAGPFFPTWDYTDATGRFKVFNDELPAGEWELFNHSMITRIGNVTTTHSSKADYSHRFKVEPGKVADLGRYCVATQTRGEVFPDSDRVWNQVPKVTYMLVTGNRWEEIEGARKTGEVVTARPFPPEKVSALLRSRFIEPRVIRVPAAPKPMEIPR